MPVTPLLGLTLILTEQGECQRQEGNERGMSEGEIVQGELPVSRSVRSCVTTLGKLFTPLCPFHQAIMNSDAL